MTICKNCGKEVIDKYSFCGYCGQEVIKIPMSPAFIDRQEFKTLVNEQAFAQLIHLCQSYLLGDEKDPAFREDDLEHYIFEAAMVFFYGDKVWEYINNKHGA